MGVYLKNVMMPSCCHDCEIMGLYHVEGICCEGERNQRRYECRPASCPLKEIGEPFFYYPLAEPDMLGWYIREDGRCITYSKKGERKENTMELKDTIDLMTSEDWRDRFKAEYMQTKIRYNKLHKMIVRREAGMNDFKTPITLDSWKTQASHMGLYLFELEKQAAVHGIDLPDGMYYKLTYNGDKKE